jgi:hypothetical protein
VDTLGAEQLTLGACALSNLVKVEDAQMNPAVVNHFRSVLFFNSNEAQQSLKAEGLGFTFAQPNPDFSLSSYH